MVTVFSSSSPCTPSIIETGVKNLSQLSGQEVRVSPNLSLDYGSDSSFSAGNEAVRAAELKKLLENNELVICTRGGYGALETLPYLVHSNLKGTLVGLSDVTALLVNLKETHCIHGATFEPYFTRFDTPGRIESCKNLISLINNDFSFYSSLSLSFITSPGQIRGAQITGGNLSILASMAGTPYQPDAADKILFLEEVKEKPFRIKRMLWQLKEAGVMDGIRGVLLGEFKECSHSAGPTTERVLEEFFHDFKVPVVNGFPGGHGDYSFPLSFKYRYNISISGQIEVEL